MTVKQLTQSLIHVLIGLLSLIVNHFIECDNTLGFRNLIKSEWFSDGRACFMVDQTRHSSEI